MTERRQQLLVEARRQRNAWVEDARDGSGIWGSSTEHPSPMSPLTPQTGGTSAHVHTQDRAMGLLVDSGVTASLPSATPLLDYLGEAITEGQSFRDLDTPIGSMDPTEIPVPTHARMPGSSDYDVLLAKLKHPSAAEVVKSLERFIKYVEENIDVPKLWEPANPRGGGSYAGHWKDNVPASEHPPAIVEAFLARLARLMRDTPLWSERVEREEDGTWARTLVCIESFLHRKLRHCLFGQTRDDVESDAAIATRLDSLGFLDAAHLDIKSLQVGGLSDTVQWDTAVERLRRLSFEAGPSAKIDEIVACSREITKVLTVALKGELPGADDFLPAMILVLKKANPPQLQSNLTFIQEYCPRARLMSEAGYIFTHLASAMAFLNDLDASQLTIDKGEFDAGLKRCAGEALLARQKQLRVRQASGSGGDGESTLSARSAFSTGASSLNGVHGSTSASAQGGGGGSGEEEKEEDRALREIGVRDLRAATRALLFRVSPPPSAAAAAAPAVAAAKTPGTGALVGERGGTALGAFTPEKNPFQVVSAGHPDGDSPVSAAEVHSKFKFLGTSVAEQLTLREVGDLLGEYKALASLAERLLAERDGLQASNLACRQELLSLENAAARDRSAHSGSNGVEQPICASAPTLQNILGASNRLSTAATPTERSSQSQTEVGDGIVEKANGAKTREGGSSASSQQVEPPPAPLPAAPGGSEQSSSR